MDNININYVSCTVQVLLWCIGEALLHTGAWGEVFREA